MLSKERILEVTGSEKYVIVTIANSGFFRMVYNWSRFLKKLKIQYDILFSFYASYSRYKVHNMQPVMIHANFYSSKYKKNGCFDQTRSLAFLVGSYGQR